jgi:hypothetical protein
MYDQRARRAGPDVGGGRGAAGFATLRMRERSPAGCEHSRRAHSAGRAAAAPDATHPVSLLAHEGEKLRQGPRRLDCAHEIGRCHGARAERRGRKGDELVAELRI